MAFTIAYRPTFVIVDAYNFFIRHYVVNPSMDVNGDPIGGVVGTLQGLRKLVDRFKPTSAFVVWDGEGSAERRRSIRGEYKEGRKVRLNREYDFNTTAGIELRNMDEQVACAREFIGLLGVGQINPAGVEADDSIAYLCSVLDGRKIVVSTDNDMLQLIGPDVDVYNPVKDRVLKAEDVLKEQGCLPSNFACVKAICGDRGDNVSGVAGVGPKGVVKIVPELATEEDMGLGRVLDLIEERAYTPGKKENVKAKANTKAVDITNMRGHIEENMRLVSLRDPLVSPDAARSIRSLATDKREFRPVSIRAKMLTDGIQLSDDFDRQFMMLASRTSLWLNGQRKNEE